MSEVSTVASQPDTSQPEASVTRSRRPLNMLAIGTGVIGIAILLTGAILGGKTSKPDTADPVARDFAGTLLNCNDDGVTTSDEKFQLRPGGFAATRLNTESDFSQLNCVLAKLNAPASMFDKFAMTTVQSGITTERHDGLEYTWSVRSVPTYSSSVAVMDITVTEND